MPQKSGKIILKLLMKQTFFQMLTIVVLFGKIGYFVTCLFVAPRIKFACFTLKNVLQRFNKCIFVSFNEPISYPFTEFGHFYVIGNGQASAFK